VIAGFTAPSFRLARRPVPHKESKVLDGPESGLISFRRVPAPSSGCSRLLMC
jgi:hypothetical protein